ncbi:uncharacterized protein [Montipora foliosa]|uniref:uncharacterized protein n=1 Tax=Montipora foliosa TaxID=591990 RepID=UPI0035F1D6B1
MADCLACESEGTEIELLLTEDVDDESLLMSLDMIECFSSSDGFEEVENELDAVWNDIEESEESVYKCGHCDKVRNVYYTSNPTDTPQPVDGSGNSAAVGQVFSMFEDYLEKKLEDKGKQIEQKSKIDKEVVQLKYTGSQKQFELNAELDTIIGNKETESNRSELNLALIKTEHGSLSANGKN